MINFFVIVIQRQNDAKFVSENFGDKILVKGGGGGGGLGGSLERDYMDDYNLWDSNLRVFMDS